jgi:3'-phosphoadenosine 5'-phosphosulfate sulfotransferase (PAPS reductase)/FAD synthetase
VTNPKVIVNVSGGKDSTVAVLETLKLYPPEDITLCWQDTGAEYAETEGHVKLLAETFRLPLVTLRHPEGFFGLAERKGYWPTPDCRHCTGELKQHVFNAWLRRNRNGDETIVVSGIRADESRSRSKLSEWSTSAELSTKAHSVTLWNPCLHMTAEQVFARIKAEGLPLHPCYEFSPRCSCWLCIFQHPNVVRAYAERRPDLYEAACLLEDDIKHTWRDGLAMSDIMRQGRLL